MGDPDKEWDFYLRTLSSSARDSNLASDPASDPSLLNSVRKLCQLCKAENSEDLVARVYPHFNKLFQRSVASLPQSKSSYGLLLLDIIQFFLDFGEIVLHDADPSLRSFFRSCLSREFADLTVAEATLHFLNVNKKRLLASFPALLPQFFPLLLKLIAWNGENIACYSQSKSFSRLDEWLANFLALFSRLLNSFLKVFPELISPASFLPLFPSLVDLPMLVVALERVERSSGSLIGSSIASIQNTTAPEMLLALMDEAYTGSTIGDGGAGSESEDINAIDSADPLFLELLKDENDGLAERHRTSPSMAAALQAAVNVPQTDRLKQSLKIGPALLDVYCALAIRDVNDSLICALIPLIMARNDVLFPDKNYSYQVRKRLLEFMLASFQRSPNFIALLKKPIMDRLGEAYDSSAKTELALQLCWAIGEHGGGGASHKDAARELFENLELLLYENLSSSNIRLQVARSRISDVRVWRRARDYLGLIDDPAISLSVLGPSQGHVQKPGTVNWRDGGTKMIAHIPFYLLGEQEGSPFHDFSFSDIFPRT
ncbi:unnamed protein product [Linum tenue]|uniref:AP-5 complex subunit zeta-1 n=1 Tax=Linum tenue TaxID=586396 RepID=A0AAV0H503_9ROSI|nr:unnamed protein product [Linum tenue]